MRSFVRIFPLVLICVSAVSAVAQTSYIREMGKCKPDIYIVASGPGTTGIAKQLQQAIISARDASGDKKVSILTFAQIEAQALADPKNFAKQSRIFLLSKDEMKEDIPLELQNFVTVDPKNAQEDESLMDALTLDSRAGKLAFAVTAYAPDVDHVRTLVQKFEAASFGNYRDMKFHADFFTRRLLVRASDAEFPNVKQWGSFAPPNVWLEHDCVKPDAPSTLKGPGDEVYFIDRAQQKTPAAAAAVLANEKISDNESIVIRSGSEPNHRVVVFSAPSHQLLMTIAKKYSNIDSIPDTPYTVVAKDVRRQIQPTVFMVLDNQEDVQPLIDQIGTELSGEMRTKMGLDVRERGAVLKELEKNNSIEQLLGDPKLKTLREKEGLNRYVWVLAFTCDPSSSYRGQETRETRDLPPFTDPEPQRPVKFRGESVAHFQRRITDYNSDEEAWQKKKEDWQYHYENDSVVWDRELFCDFQVTAKGRLLLLDTENAGKVAWEPDKPLEVSASATKRITTDHFPVKGYGTHVPSIEAPSEPARVPDTAFVEAATKLGNEGMEFAQQQLWLPGDGPNPEEVVTAPMDPVHAEIGSITSSAGVRSTFAIAELSPKVVITLGADGGLKVGDKVIVPITHVVRDPRTHEVIETQVIAKITLVVKQTFKKTACCVPTPGQSAAQVKKLKVGMEGSCPRLAAAKMGY